MANVTCFDVMCERLLASPSSMETPTSWPWSFQYLIALKTVFLEHPTSFAIVFAEAVQVPLDLMARSTARFAMPWAPRTTLLGSMVKFFIF